MSEVVDIPLSSLSEEALSGLIEEVITREGTDYGEIEYSLEQKIRQLTSALRTGDAKIIFDLVHDHVDIIPVQR